MEAAKIGPDLELGQVSQNRAVIETCMPARRNSPTYSLLSSNQGPITLLEYIQHPTIQPHKVVACVVSVSIRAFALARSNFLDELSRKRLPRRLHG